MKKDIQSAVIKYEIRNNLQFIDFVTHGLSIVKVTHAVVHA